MIRKRLEHVRDMNERLLNQIAFCFPNHHFKQTTNEFDLKYHADLEVTVDNHIEYWLLRYRNYPYRDFTLRVKAKKYKSEFEKVYDGTSISTKYMLLILDKHENVDEIFVVDLQRLRQHKAFLDYAYQNQRIKNDFVYITPKQLFSLFCVDYYKKMRW